MPTAGPKSPVTIDPRAVTLAKDILKEVWGYTAFRLEQEAAITRLICGGNAAVIFPTGGGKSLVYQVPALAFDKFDKICGRPVGLGVTLVVSPLIALMKDQTQALKKRGVKVAALDSTQDRDSVLETYQMLRTGELKLLYVAPERLNNEGFVETIKDVKIRMVAVDEAHCVSEWGTSFRPIYLTVARFVKEVNAERVLCLTATATPKVTDDILQGFDIEAEGLFRTPMFRSNLRLLAKAAQSETEKLAHLKQFLKANPGPTIVYVATHAQTQAIAAALEAEGFRVAAYHAGLANPLRTEVQDRFMAASDMIIVATIAFGMGVDKPDIRNIVHYTIPKSLEGYSQEIGRAGRDGLPSTCFLYLSAADIKQIESFSRADVPSLQSVHGLLESFFGEWPYAQKGVVVETNMTNLSKKWDIRPTCLALLFSQLDLRFGIVRAITPKYSSYSYQANEGFSSLNKSDRISQALVSASKKGKWTTVDVDMAASCCGRPREQVVRTLQSWATNGHIELKPSGVINRLRVLKPFPSKDEIKDLAEKAHQQLETKELENIERIKSVVELMAGHQCYARALAAYFGDELEDPCKRCGFCETGSPIKFEWPGNEMANVPIDETKIKMVLDAVGELNWNDARFLARVGWGITSPRSTSLRLGKTKAWGCCEGVPFDKLVKAFEVHCVE
ncbi:P-loop containing nucleoside triphosphate hydrolase protein [Sphaerosporella brunnea]|uniref:ATP-dependent DNA helicase n=1 Tax=Sphaerosporella brunnea TaxID=1250544 RepID=A0A5J5EKM9_9PEZI|nr:P-loop containing nucleoside triphosphate hydrolase protein [Sphaerosporella brunnea]